MALQITDTLDLNIISAASSKTEFIRNRLAKETRKFEILSHIFANICLDSSPNRPPDLLFSQLSQTFKTKADWVWNWLWDSDWDWRRNDSLFFLLPEVIRLPPAARPEIVEPSLKMLQLHGELIYIKLLYRESLYEELRAAFHNARHLIRFDAVENGRSTNLLDFGIAKLCFHQLSSEKHKRQRNGIHRRSERFLNLDKATGSNPEQTCESKQSYRHNFAQWLEHERLRRWHERLRRWSKIKARQTLARDQSFSRGSVYIPPLDSKVRAASRLCLAQSKHKCNSDATRDIQSLPQNRAATSKSKPMRKRERRYRRKFSQRFEHEKLRSWPIIEVGMIDSG